MQRSLFLLSGMARLLGQWQLALPGSLFAARQVAASFLARVAQARPGERLTFHCPPVSPSEKACTLLAATRHAGLPSTAAPASLTSSHA